MGAYSGLFTDVLSKVKADDVGVLSLMDCVFVKTDVGAKMTRGSTDDIIIIIIIIDFYGAYILRNLSSEAQQNRISRRNRKQGRAKVSIRMRDNCTFMVGMQFGIDMS